MTPLLSRQLRKYFPQEWLGNRTFDAFLEAIDQSYATHEHQLKMSQRAMKISSDELFDVNHKLREEAQKQKSIIDGLHHLVDTISADENLATEKNVKAEDMYVFFEEQSKEILRIHRQKEVLMKDLEQKNQVLSDYAHMVSHDLKSPLRSIDTLVHWIMEENAEQISASCGEEFDMILKNLERMDGLINGILDYSTIERKNLDVYDVDIQEMLDETVHLLLVPAHIEIKISNAMPIIRGNRFRLQQVFQNLIQNAIKSIDKEEGIIEIGVEPVDFGWQFYVSDNGKGIAEQHQKRIFQIFEKLENDNSTGIGLSIVKKIVEFYQGEIWLTSKEGIGTTFYFTLKGQ